MSASTMGFRQPVCNRQLMALVFDNLKSSNESFILFRVGCNVCLVLPPFYKAFLVGRCWESKLTPSGSEPPHGYTISLRPGPDTSTEPWKENDRLLSLRVRGHGMPLNVQVISCMSSYSTTKISKICDTSTSNFKCQVLSRFALCFRCTRPLFPKKIGALDPSATS